ncbi:MULTISPECIES: Rrf2 family transcriptional regulator [Clostridium]|jgi:DNA-binding IscR family transcriptional regulator|uniref:Rrf2 family transcriptional regulator n=1 Tax=Clostridium TaxID=1485 RepID=UPI0002C94696|nr:MULTISPECIES: Rrf2 family transcriptional regulator [Clostridium]AXB83917.1 Rrf2 family transcriptional regulator [Clostridium butyricum]EMU55732.1 hypothetical protein CBDKU1_04600 [Clostridium butyricum DKU-01]KIU06805.1 hypothetical protein SC08_Contig83orf00608 [Clostridium butyricum]KQB79116.1 hypothetical protein AK964_03805 [Clostridium butyricum]MBA8966640.1 DNA-binding IscR family transcriptional regulator [Clostridium butyricum]
MRIDTKCSIGIHCMILIAVYGDKCKLTSEIISKSTGCNNVIIRNILSKFKKRGFISIARGVGGTVMNCNLDDISIWDIYSALDDKEPAKIIGIHPNPYEKCPVGHCIEDILNEPYRRIGDAIKNEMKKYTLDKIVDEFYKKESQWEDVLKR